MMSTHAAGTHTCALAAYDREAAYTILRDWTPRRLMGELRSGHFGARLSTGEAAELEEHLTAWAQRALAELPLRDALLVDERRGRRVFALICVDLTAARAPIPPELAVAAEGGAALLASLGPEPALAALAARAARDSLALAVQHRHDDYPFPEDLERLAPTPPPTPVDDESFEQPVGWRRSIAALLAGVGVALLAIPMLGGHIPDHPAGLPLALLTAALLVGIRAGWQGYAGSLCIWLVANLPGFRHGTHPGALWPALPLMAAGLLLLSLDRHVRVMWRWIRDCIAR